MTEQPTPSETSPPPATRSGLNEQTVRRSQIAVLAAVVLALVVLYFTSAAVRTELQILGGIAARNDVAALKTYLLSFGEWAPIISIGLMILQSIIAPIPAFLIVFANGLAFGTINGWLLSLFGQMLAAAVCFWIARILGRDVVHAMIGRMGLESADQWFARWGVLGLFVTRLVPGVGFDAISYAAGLTGMTFRTFMLVTLAGSAPQLLLYSYLGENATQYIWWLLGATVVVGVVIGLYALIKKRRQDAAAVASRAATQHPSASS